VIASYISDLFYCTVTNRSFANDALTQHKAVTIVATLSYKF